MKRVFSSLFALLSLSVPVMADEGITLVVTITNVPGVKGNLLVGLYDSAKSFTDNPLPNSPLVPVTSENDVTVSFENVKPGTYAVSVIQDLNGNGKLDKNLVGMPKEPLAFSVIREIPRGKPKFEQCSFEVGASDMSLKIPLVLE